MFSDRIFPTPDNPVCLAILESSKGLPHYTKAQRCFNTLYVLVSYQGLFREVGVKLS